MKRLALAAALVLGLAAPSPAQDGAAAPAPARKVPKDPSGKVGDRILDALRALLEGSGAARVAAQATLESAVADWAAEAKDDPLKAVKWWKGALASTLTTGSKRSGIGEVKVAYAEGREARLWVSVPKSYSPKNLHPLLLVILDRDEDPKRALPAHYGDLLKDWIVVAIPADPRQAGFDVTKEWWLAGLGLRHAIDEYRVDRDRVVLDAGPGSSNTAAFLGAEWAVHFAGCVLRGPTEASPLASNLSLCRTLAVLPEAATPPQKDALEKIRAAAPETTVLAEGGAGAEAVQAWIQETPPRRITGPDLATYSWKTRPQGGEPWAYWLWVFKAADARRDRYVTLTVTRDAAGGILDIAGDNLAEGILLLNDDHFDLDRDLQVRVNGREVWKGRAQRRVHTMLYWIGQTGERTLFVPAEVRFTVPADAVAPARKEPPKEGAAEKGAGGGL